MKSLFVFMLSIALVASSFAQSSRYKGSNLTESVITTFTTSDSVTTNAQTITIDSNSVGIVDLYVIGFSVSTGDGVTCRKTIRYKKLGGTLTLGTSTDILATETDSGLSGAAVSFSTNSNSLIIRVKGKLATTVTWRLIVRRRSVLKVS